MGDKDASPFGYTFSGSLFDAEPTPFDPSRSLLTDSEHQSIANFFSNTDPFQLPDSQAFPAGLDAKDSIDGFHNWEDFITPATVHGVSTTIPDQSHLHNDFYSAQPYAQSSHTTHHFGNTPDDLQAASTLFRNSQSSYTESRPHDFAPLQSSSANPPANGISAAETVGKPLVITQHGILSEQLAALIPNHAEAGTLDAQFAAQWASQNPEQLAEGAYPAIMSEPTLKRSYTFGTDETFKEPTPFSMAHVPGQSDEAARRLMLDLTQARPYMPGSEANGRGSNGNGRIRGSTVVKDGPSDEESEQATSEEEDEKPAKKRRKSKVGKESSQKGKMPARNRKSSAAEEPARKKRATAQQKLQRENLSEEQKRSNHILSEQKRRNLIKRGFDDLHDLVPEIRNGGLSKSAVLTEAGNFLEKLIDENKNFRQLASG